MARIRTIKPEFFTSEDIVGLSPLARLLYIALWCEADRDGRMVWKPRTFKMRYLPGDDCNIFGLCDEIVAAGLVVLYGDGLACVPQFERHQHVNPREAKSELPAPQKTYEKRLAAPEVMANGGPDDVLVAVDDDGLLPKTDDLPPDLTRAPRVSTRANQDDDVQVGKERKGREGARVADDDANPCAPPDALQPPPTPPPSPPSMAGAVCVALKSVGMGQVSPAHLGLKTLLDDGAGLDLFVDVGRECVDRGKGFAYLLATVRGRLADAQKLAASATAGSPAPGGLLAGAI